MYHDMGLIQVLGALIYGGRIGLMTPLGFLRDPFSWMRNMTHHRSTVTAGPTFAYRAAVDALARGGTPPSDVDLSELRHAYVGLSRSPRRHFGGFAERFAPWGLRRDALVPSYGMAESVLATTIASDPAPEGLATSAASAPCRPTAWAPPGVVRAADRRNARPYRRFRRRATR